MSSPRFKDWADVKAALVADAAARRASPRPWICAFCGELFRNCHDPCPRCGRLTIEFRAEIEEHERRTQRETH